MTIFTNNNWRIECEVYRRFLEMKKIFFRFSGQRLKCFTDECTNFLIKISRRQNLRLVYPTNHLTLDSIWSKFNFHRELFVQKTHFNSEIEKNICFISFLSLCHCYWLVNIRIFFIWFIFSNCQKSLNQFMHVIVYTLSLSSINKMKSAMKWNFLNVSILINQQMQFNMPSSCSRGCFFYIHAVHQMKVVFLFQMKLLHPSQSGKIKLNFKSKHHWLKTNR